MRLIRIVKAADLRARALFYRFFVFWRKAVVIYENKLEILLVYDRDQLVYAAVLQRKNGVGYLDYEVARQRQTSKAHVLKFLCEYQIAPDVSVSDHCGAVGSDEGF